MSPFICFGGSVIDTPATVNSNGITGTVTVTGDCTISTVGTKPTPHSIGLTFNISSGAQAEQHCHWIRIIKRDGTGADGTTAVTGPYSAKTPYITPKQVGSQRTWGQPYCDALTTKGWDANVRPDVNTEVATDAPSDSGLAARGGLAKTTWTATDYLIYDGVVIYQVTWTATETAAAPNTVTYAVVNQGTAAQIQGNPKTLDLGYDETAKAEIVINNPAYVAP